MGEEKKMEHVPRGDTESDLVTLENGWKGGDFEATLMIFLLQIKN